MKDLILKLKLSIPSILIFGVQFTFFYLLFIHIENIYSNLTSVSSLETLNNLTEGKAKEIEHTTQTILKNTKTFNKSFMFFYLDNYTKRKVFTGKGSLVSSSTIEDISSDIFYKKMLNQHLKDKCYIENTLTIEKESMIYSSLKKSDELKRNLNYISCPIFIEGTLLGYIGGMNNTFKYPISYSLLDLENAALLIENSLGKKEETKLN